VYLNSVQKTGDVKAGQGNNPAARFSSKPVLVSELPLYRRAFNSVSLPLLICNREGRVEDANQASCKAFGLQQTWHENGETPLSAVLSQPSADLVALLIRRVLGGRRIPFAFIAHRDGPGGVSEKYSAKIIKFDEELVLVELQPAGGNGVIDSLWQAKVRAMLHDLKSPVNSIVGFSDFLLTRTDLENDPQTIELLGYIKSAGEKLMGQVNNQLTADLTHDSTIATPRLEWFDLSLFVREAATNLCRGCDITVNENPLGLQGQEPGPMVLQDASFLALMLNNLLSNAMKYTSGGKVSIDYAVSSGRVVLTVRDYGRGVPRGEEGRLFDSAKELSNRQNGSTHLGLPLTKMLAKVLCGDVHYAPAVPGASFTIILPDFGNWRP
jgi:signal transduction histidine kinase